MTKRWTPSFTSEHWQELSRKTLFKGFFQLDSVTLRHCRFDGEEQEVEREIFMRGDAVAVLLYDPAAEQVVLVEQIRSGALDHPQGPWCLELVAGMVEEGEQPIDVARREALEESGAELGEIEKICRYMSSPGGSREYIDLFCASVDSRQLGGIYGVDGEGEDIKVHLVTREAALAMVEDGSIDNAATIIALQWLALHHQRIKQCWGGSV